MQRWRAMPRLDLSPGKYRHVRRLCRISSPVRHHAQPGQHRLIPVCLALLLAIPVLNFPASCPGSPALPACCRHGSCPMRAAGAAMASAMSGMSMPHRCSGAACACSFRSRPAVAGTAVSTPRLSPHPLARFRPARLGWVAPFSPAWREYPPLSLPPRPPRPAPAIHLF